jgi:hypothetical protein
MKDESSGFIIQSMTEFFFWHQYDFMILFLTDAKKTVLIRCEIISGRYSGSCPISKKL